jgi:hypothetical protein
LDWSWFWYWQLQLSFMDCWRGERLLFITIRICPTAVSWRAWFMQAGPICYWEWRQDCTAACMVSLIITGMTMIGGKNHGPQSVRPYAATTHWKLLRL